MSGLWKKKSTIIRKHRFIKKASLMHLIFKNMATRGGAMGVSSFPSSPSCFRKNGRATSSTTLHLVCMCLFWNKCIGVIIFGLVWFLSKKNNQTEIFFWKKNRNRVKPTGFGSVRFFRAKTGSNRFGSVFSVLARFFPVLARFFLVWLGFSGLARFFFRFFVGFGSVFCL